MILGGDRRRGGGRDRDRGVGDARGVSGGFQEGKASRGVPTPRVNIIFEKNDIVSRFDTIPDQNEFYNHVESSLSISKKTQT